MIISIVLCLIVINSALWADEIVLNDGKIIKGKIIQVTKDHIEYDLEGKVPFNILPRTDIVQLIYSDGTVVNLSERKKLPPVNKNTTIVTKRYDEIHLKDGTVLKGKISKVTNKYIAYDPEGIKEFDLYPMGQIEKFVYADGKTVLINYEKDKRNNKSFVNEGGYTHDGFFLRFQFGLGYGRIVFKDWPGMADDSADWDNRGDIKYDQSTFNFRIQIGYAVINNLILFGEMGMFNLTNPDWEQSGESGSTKNYEIDVFDFGWGISYYFMPSNIYLTGSFTFTDTDVRVGNEDPLVADGTGVCISIGKEWWVSDNWGLGVSILGSYSETKLEIENDQLEKEKIDIQNLFIGVAFSATYN